MVIYGNKYLIDNSHQIFLYGAATTGKIFMQRLQYLNITNISGFIDKRADEIPEYQGLSVYSIDEIASCSNKDSIIVFLAIKNVFEHESIAKKLWKIGINKIIFLSNDFLNGKHTGPDNMLNQLWNFEITDSTALFAPEISGFKFEPMIPHGILKDEGTEVIANIWAPYVFTEDFLSVPAVPCLGLIGHIGMFQKFLGIENEDWLIYLTYCRDAATKSGGIETSKSWEDTVIHRFLDIFHHMEYSYEHDTDFFLRSAVRATLGSDGNFHIHSGKHRNCYLLAKGKRYLPLRISKQDYELFINQKKSERIWEYLQNTEELQILPGIYQNPFFYNYPTTETLDTEKALFSLIGDYYRNQTTDSLLPDKKEITLTMPQALWADAYLTAGYKVKIIENNPALLHLLKMIYEQPCSEISF